MWMVENVQYIHAKQNILMNTAKEKFVVVVGEHDFEVGGRSPVPAVHVNKFGFARVFCPTFDEKFLLWDASSIDRLNFNHAMEMCPVKTYIRSANCATD